MQDNLQYQAFRSPKGIYMFAYPETWVYEVIEEIPAFYDPETNDGAFQISSFQNKELDFDLSEEMNRFLELHKIEFDEEKVASFTNNEGSKILACEFISDSRFWLVYMVANKFKLLVCTYNSDNKPTKDLSIILTNMISSIRFLGE
jgi:hypothetical protein